MRDNNSPAESARALDEISFEASLHALVTVVTQLERTSAPRADVPAEAVLVRSTRERLSR